MTILVARGHGGGGRGRGGSELCFILASVLSRTPKSTGYHHFPIPSLLRHSVLGISVAAMVMFIENISGPVSLPAHFKHSKILNHLCTRGMDDSFGVLDAFYALTMPFRPCPLEIPRIPLCPS